MTARIGRSVLIPGVALALAAAACSGSSGGNGDEATSGEDGGGTPSSIMSGWTDEICEVFNPDAVTEQLHIETYTEGPVELGTTEGNYPGGLKCNSMYDFPDYELPEGYSARELDGWLNMVLLPYASEDEAASAYQELYDDAAGDLHGQPEQAQVVDETITGDWDQGAILASVGPGNSTRVMYQKDTYMVFIEIGYKPDPGVERGLSNNTIDTFEDPTYEFTPPELAEWFKSDYLPGLQETITLKLEE